MITKEDPPLLTFAIFAHNQERFIREAIEGAFSQTYNPLEVILSDDCSSDRTFEIMVEMAKAYKGQHKIILNRNDKNLGIGGHVNRVMELSSGELIVIAAGDDISLAERVERIYTVYKESGGSAKSIFSNNTMIDERGEKGRAQFDKSFDQMTFSPELIVMKDWILSGCSHAWARDLFCVFGLLKVPLTCEDMVIPFRSALIGEIRYIHEELVMYRRHDANTWQLRPKNYNMWAQFRCKEWLAIFDNWLRDLAKFGEICPSQKDRIESLRKSILSRSTIVKKDLDLLNSSWPRKVVLLGKELIKGASLKSVRYRVGVFLVPSMYNKYMMWKNSAIQNKR